MIPLLYSLIVIFGAFEVGCLRLCCYLYLFVFSWLTVCVWAFCAWFGFTLVGVDSVVVFDVGVGVTGYALCWLWTCW